MDLRRVRDAAMRGDYAAVLRLARAGRGWTQAQLGQRVNVSRTVVSRFETGDRRLRDVELRRRFAEALDMPVEMFGLSGLGGPKVGGDQSEGEDVRRRAFLAAAGAAVLAADRGSVHGPVSSARTLTDRIEQA